MKLGPALVFDLGGQALHVFGCARPAPDGEHAVAARAAVAIAGTSGALSSPILMGEGDRRSRWRGRGRR